MTESYSDIIHSLSLFPSLPPPVLTLIQRSGAPCIPHRKATYINIQGAGLLQKPELRAGTSLTPPAGTQAAFPAPEGNTQGIPATPSTERGGNSKRIALHGPKLQHSHPGYLLIQAKTSNTRVTAAMASLTHPAPLLLCTEPQALAFSWPLQYCFILAPWAPKPQQQHPLRYCPWHVPQFIGVTPSFACVPLAQLDWKYKSPLREKQGKRKAWTTTLMLWDHILCFF